MTLVSSIFNVININLSRIFEFIMHFFQSKTFNVTAGDTRKTAGLTLDWNMGFALYDTQARTYSWQYKFSQLRGSSDDGKSRLKLHFQDSETKAIETKVIKYRIQFYF